MTRPLIIDTDPGTDDAVAIMLAAASPEVRIIGISAVAGNTDVGRTAANAAALADLLDLDCPVGRGASGPLWRRDTVAGTAFHGEDGLGGYELPRSSRTPEPGISMLARLIESSPDPVTIVGIGPLTNLALLMAEQPETTRKVERIIIMGGGTNDALGNATAAAEFNIYYDPDAAARVFDFGVPLTMVGLNVTNRTLVSRKHLPSLFASGGKISHMVGHILDDHQQRWGGDGSMAQHDALAMAALIDPDVISTRLLPVDVENTGRLTAGMTVVDYRASGGEGGDQRPANVDVALDVDVSRFRALLDERLSELDRILQ